MSPSQIGTVAGMIRRTELAAAAFCLLLGAGCDDPSGSTSIGPEGGEVRGGGARVDVPAGALSGDVEIGVAAVSGVATLPSGFEAAGPAIAFTPHGTTFASPARLELPHDGSATGAMRLDDESDTTWEPLTPAELTGELVLLDVARFSVIVATRDAGPPGPRDGAVGETDGAVGETDGAVGETDGGGGDVDAGPPGSDAGGVCADPAPGAPTGTATVTGTAYPVVDAVARVVHLSDVGTAGGGMFAYRSDLLIELTEHADACGLLDAGTRDMDTRWLRITLAEYSNTARPGLPGLDTYTWMSRPPWPEDTVLLLGTGDLVANDGTGCGDGSSLGALGDPSGSVTLTSVTATRVEGSFTWTNPDGTTWSGTFSAPICGTTEANPTYCCR